MSHQVALSFEDGVTRFITCEPDQTVADASYRQRINIPLDCRDGACGTCKAFCESGDFNGGDYLDDALTDGEAAQGYVLPCSMTPKSDLVLRIATTSEVAKTQAGTFEATVTGLDRLSPTTVALTLDTPQRDDLAFLPGQYVNIAVPGTDETRSYSFSNGPDEKSLTFLMKLAPGGVMSDYLTDRAAVGDRLTVTGPHGSFFLRETDRPVLLLAGGTGLAPILSILRTMAATGSRRPVHLIYGASTDDDVVELGTIAELAAQLPQLTWDYVVADPASTAPNKGYVMSLIRDEHLYGGDVAVYLCGPPPMVEAVRTHFTERGIEPTGIYYEKFAVAAAPETTDTADGDTGVGDGHDPTAPEATMDSAVLALEPEPLLEAVHLGAGEGRRIAGQDTFPGTTAEPVGAGVATAPAAADEADTMRAIARQPIWPSGGGQPFDRDPGEDLLPAGTARAIAGQEMHPADDTIAPVAAPASTAPVAVASAPAVTTATTAPAAPVMATADGYEIGEEHPSVHESDAVFDARQALELGAVELTIGRLTSQQLSGFRLLAEATVPYVDGDRFVDAAAYTETNAAFHDYLFTLTGNDHLLQAYRALGVKGHMDEVLRDATWCDPRCTQDHLDIVEAFEAGDRQAARSLVAEHAARSKATTRRAMKDAQHAKRPAFVSPGRFDGKVVVVTGSAQGIGERAARRIGAEGGQVVLADRSDLVTGVADDLVTAGGQAHAVLADLETYEGAQSVVTAALEKFGRIDVLINNVGGAMWFKPYTEFTAEQIQAEINRSLMTTLWSCRAALPEMVRQGGGTVVNVSSVARRGIHRIPYSAAKGGINAITESLAMEYADAGIRVVATAPGGTEAPPRRIPRGGDAPQTDQEKAWFQAHIDQTVDSSLLKRYGTLDEQAAVIAFLASDEAAYVTGTVVPVAGGDQG
ncbi:MULTISPECIES: benzoate 1,2-dioxygenase electron transfer component BenC [Prauserella salsuginis group]|uniref:Benzoate 1,2-dioxygenase electron transfer component BenC n=1 Tax=Prauserella salsuginis TaxID=387889 RepID=A0ABW6G660_9PSEU|nr:MULTISPECIES: benzoate 1,2-dioxygenase electron transfer component BenC [Prauserella salsuginis group]MCR3719289.1 benzoate/toluate 1,2-dioxygenase reductase subunit [Prauserella flava]MCR3735698.1 benzoate/toluate 1,2-dioxygenase reductase subunit [Prauserella salsuginis]